MPSLETLQVKDLQQVINDRSLKRARGYVESVREATRIGHTLRAKVGKGRIYEIEIDVLQDSPHAICSCLYNWGGYCKHIGAVLLKWIEQPGSFTVEELTTDTPNSIIETIAVEPPKTVIPQAKPFWLQKNYRTRCQEDDDSLLGWLNEYKVQELRQIAKQQGWPIKGTLKADIIQQIMHQMLQPGILIKSLLGLDAEHRQVYDALGMLYPGIIFRTEHLVSLANQWGTLSQYKKIDAYFAHLYDAGLVIPGSFDQRYLQQMPFIPNSLMRKLPPLLTDRIPERPLAEGANSAVILGQPGSFLQRLHQILLLLEQSQPPMRQPMPRPRLEKFHEILREWDYNPEEILDAMQKNMFKAYDPNLSLTVPPPILALPDDVIQRLAPIAGDEAQLTFIYHLLLALGLLQPGSPVTVWREVKEQYLRHDEAGQWAILARSYFALDTWSELWLMLADRPSLQLKRASNRYHRSVKPKMMYEMLAVFRGQVLQTLACLPDDCWFNLDDITDLLHSLWPRFDSWAWSPAQPYGDTRPDLYLAKDGHPLDTANNKAHWNEAQGAFIQQIIQGPLLWLGLADISTENGRLVAFRLHGLGDLFLDKVESIPLVGVKATAVLKEKPAVSAAIEAVAVDGTTITVNPSAVSAQAHHYLDSIAVLEEAGTNRFVYQLNATAVHQAFEDEQTLNEMLEGWEKWLPIPMPDAVHYQLKAWQEAYGLVRLYEDVTVIEFGDEYALAEMKAATSLEKHLAAEISPTLVIIPSHVVNLLTAELEKAGYTPKKTDKV